MKYEYPKFRAWLIPQKKMYMVSSLDFLSETVNLVKDNGEIFEVPREQVKIMQASGLRETQFWDEETKEIFEGDIIDWSYSDGIDLEQHSRFVVVLQNGAFKVGDDNDETLYEYLEDCDVKIVGNIYENKK